MSKIILAANVAAVAGIQFSVTKKSEPKTLTATGLAGSEYVDIQSLDAAGVWVTSSSANRLTATDPVRPISSEGEFRLFKSATVAAVYCSISG